jgi:hypothetical protein
MVPVVGVDCAPTTVVATEAYTLSPGPTISMPVSGSIPVSKQLGSVGGRGLETLPSVSDYAVLTIVVANYWTFSACLWPLVVHYRPRRPVP